MSATQQNINLAFGCVRTGQFRFVFMPPKNIKDELHFIKGLLEKGSFEPVIDRKYPIDKTVEAYHYVATGQKLGNVIITRTLKHLKR